MLHNKYSNVKNGLCQILNINIKHVVFHIFLIH